MIVEKKIIVFLFILLVLCIGGIGVRNSRKNSLLPLSSSHALRHSAKRHMLAHVDNVDNTSISLDYIKLHADSLVHGGFEKADSNHTTTASLTTDGGSDSCHIIGPCHSLLANCIKCPALSNDCVYGENVNVTCEAKSYARCQGNRSFIRTYNCRFCYQTPAYEHVCQRNTSCHVVSSPRQRYVTKCSVKPHILCLGNRDFHKHVPCNWTKGYSWGTALLLSIVFGGFGVDRFYLGMWQEGIGKLFSFGGLGVWTLVDVILIATGYLGPADRSLYIRN
ncbi:TM2 domain-containing protein C41D11.9 [Parasteatoda tepidariorum]|uniref:TM2 domain-containing protein C41D11.9 n=1 Tax=Parasteatoda tepidariorum TaxID=114398 RepID=UPI001C723C88|nr:TM2 domain-containing protein 3 [Parasteatoda tepidariorum]